MYIPFYKLDAAAEVKKRGIEEGKIEASSKSRVNLWQKEYRQT
jgi:hypothetical protein